MHAVVETWLASVTRMQQNSLWDLLRSVILTLACGAAGWYIGYRYCGFIWTPKCKPNIGMSLSNLKKKTSHTGSWSCTSRHMWQECLNDSSRCYFLQCHFNWTRQLKIIRGIHLSLNLSPSIPLSCCAATLWGVLSWLATADLPRDRPDEIASSAAALPRKQAEDRELQNEQVVVVVGGGRKKL